MPAMISLRALRLATKTGHVIRFEANTPRAVPDSAVQEAMAAGCAPANPQDAPFLDDLSRTKVEFHGDLRRSTIFLALTSIAEKNNAKEFDGGGTPKVEVVSARLGYEVTRKEVNDLYQQFLSSKNVGQDFALHPQAQNIMRVIEADSKGELIELAIEFGVEEKKANGLTVRELRKLLLAKFSGVAAG